MTDPKGIYNGPGNTGLATSITGAWQPAFMVSERQRKEGDLKKQQEAANQQKAAEGNDKFGEDLFKEKFSSLDTQRNEYKNSILSNLRESYNQANLKYSANGQSIPLEERQRLQKELQGFRDEWEQVETAYNYTQGILEQAEKDKTGVYKVDAFREVLMDVPVDEQGNIDFSKYNERYVENKIKENADILYDIPKAAQLYAQTLAENILGSVKDMGDGRHEEIIEKANGMVQVFTDTNGKSTLVDENGESHINVSNESVALARKDKYLGPAMDAMVRKGEVENYADALRKVASGQVGVERTVDRQGTVKTDKDGGGRGGFESGEEDVFKLLAGMVGLGQSVEPSSLASLENLDEFRNLKYLRGNTPYKPGSKEFNKAIHDISLGGERFYPGDRSDFDAIEMEVYTGKDKKGQPVFEKQTYSIRDKENQKKTIRIIRNYLSKVEEYKNGTISQAALNRAIKELDDSLYDMGDNNEVVNPEGESLYQFQK